MPDDVARTPGARSVVLHPVGRQLRQQRVEDARRTGEDRISSPCTAAGGRWTLANGRWMAPGPERKRGSLVIDREVDRADPQSAVGQRPARTPPLPRNAPGRMATSIQAHEFAGRCTLRRTGPSPESRTSTAPTRWSTGMPATRMLRLTCTRPVPGGSGCAISADFHTANRTSFGVLVVLGVKIRRGCRQAVGSSRG
jgi:hypothetical protein